jgi:hypothetical protein
MCPEALLDPSELRWQLRSGTGATERSEHRCRAGDDDEAGAILGFPSPTLFVGEGREERAG